MAMKFVFLLFLHAKNFKQLRKEDLVAVKEMDYTYRHITGTRKGFQKGYFSVVKSFLSVKERSEEYVSKWIDVLVPGSGMGIGEQLKDLTK